MSTVKFKGNIENKFFIDLQGESNYQGNIRKVIMADIMVEKDDMEYRDEKLIAHLILEDKNQYDPGNAVRVDIEGRTVGYLSRVDASKYRRGLVKKDLTGVVGECRAMVAGKREDDGKKMNFGVWLSIDLKDLEPITEFPTSKPASRPSLFGFLFNKK